MKRLFTLLLSMMITIIINSQAPQKLSYQAVIRNNSGQLVTNHSVGIRATVLQGSPSGSVVYQETFNSLSNANGLVSIEIGGGTPVSGTFSTINWASGSYYLRTETDPSGGTTYTISGTSQLISVPYALHAKNAASYTETDPVFGAAPAKAITSGLITNWNTAYGWGNHAGLYRPISYVPAWSEITSKPTTVSGYGISDAVTLAGNQTITGIKTFNSDIIVNTLTVGIGSGSSTNNTSFGYHALFNNLTGGGNTANGYGALGSNTSGDYNTAVGLNTLVLNKTGRYNIGIGYLALRNNFSGEDNTAIGNSALYTNVIGAGNVAIGNGALYKSIGSGSTVIGYNAGYNNSGTNNVLLGYLAGYWETGSNKLFIDNQARASESDARSKALIYGVFNEDPLNQVVALNARVGIGTSNPGTRLSIVGLTSSAVGSALIINGNNVYYMSSTRSSKDNIQTLNDDFSKILSASPVSFTDKNTGMRGIGYIAEEFEDAGLQNLLVYENGKLISLRYDLISLYSLEVIKEQKKQIDDQQVQIKDQQNLIENHQKQIKDQEKLLEDQQKQINEIKQELQLLRNGQ